MGKGNVPNVFGYSFLNVTTGSMLPTYEPGDIIVAKKTRIADLREQDVISFYAMDPAIEGMPNTHRIIEIDIIDGRYYIITKGDANAVKDPYPVFEEKVIGKAVAKLPSMGKIVSVLQNRAVIFFLLILPLMAIMVLEIKHIGALFGKKETHNDTGTDIEAEKQKAVDDYIAEQKAHSSNDSTEASKGTSGRPEQSEEPKS